MIDNALDNYIANILQNFGVNWNPAAGTVNGATYDSYTNPLQAAYRSIGLFELSNCLRISNSLAHTWCQIRWRLFST